MKRPLWGCPGMNFKVTMPFHKMRQVYAAFEKRPPWPLQTYFEAVKCYNKTNIDYPVILSKDLFDRCALAKLGNTLCNQNLKHFWFIAPIGSVM
jgi:hypothetical protein